MNAADAVAATIETYRQEIVEIAAGNGTLLSALRDELDAAGLDGESDYFYDVTDEVKGALSANAANMLVDQADQEEAISEIEKWVAANVSNAGTDQNILAALWNFGAEQAAASIRSELASNSPRR